MNERVRKMIFSHPREIRALLSIYNRLNLKNRFAFKKQQNKLHQGAVLLNNVRITINGHGNEIVIKDFSRLNHCSISINGNNNRIFIGERCYLLSVGICIEDDGNAVEIGTHTSFAGSTELAAIEGTKITIGEDCMFSGDIRFRTGDSHSIFNLDGKRINPSADIVVGDHCWIGSRAMCLKGTEIKSHSIVAAAAVVSGKFEQSHCIIGGIPAKVLKHGVDWGRERI